MIIIAQPFTVFLPCQMVLQSVVWQQCHLAGCFFFVPPRALARGFNVMF